MNRVVLEEINKVVEVHEWVVDCRDLSLGGVLGREARSEGESSDSSKSVDSKSD